MVYWHVSVVVFFWKKDKTKERKTHKLHQEPHSLTTTTSPSPSLGRPYQACACNIHLHFHFLTGWRWRVVRYLSILAPPTCFLQAHTSTGSCHQKVVFLGGGECLECPLLPNLIRVTSRVCDGSAPSLGSAWSLWHTWVGVRLSARTNNMLVYSALRVHTYYWWLSFYSLTSTVLSLATKNFYKQYGEMPVCSDRT